MRKKILSFSSFLNTPIKLILALLLVSFPFIGGDCDDNVIGGGSGDIAGTWRLVYIGGNLQDVCLGEIVTYQSNGVATLQCPNQSPITRNYTVSNDVLTYSPSGLQYSITELTQATLVLDGINVGRILKYDKVPADDPGNENHNVSDGINSSE
jgi:hypothetical protein